VAHAVGTADVDQRPPASRRARASRRWRFVSFGLRPITTPLVFALRGPPRDGCGSTRARTQQSHPSASASACRTAAVVSAQVSSSESRRAGDGTKQIGKTLRADLVAASPLDCVSTHSGGDRRGARAGSALVKHGRWPRVQIHARVASSATTGDVIVRRRYAARGTIDRAWKGGRHAAHG
jgi:hypothetical protein